MMMNAVETCSNAIVKTLTLKCKTLNQFKQIHAHLIKSHLPENPIAIGPLLSVAATSNNPSFFSYARFIFTHLRFRNTFMYNTMIRGYLQNDNHISAFSCYSEMLRFGFVPNNYTFPPLIKACSCSSSSISNAKLIGCMVHGHVSKLGFEFDRFVGSALIEFYSEIFEMGNARKVFDEMPMKDVVLWTTLIDGYGKNEDVKNARKLFDEMPQRNVISWSAIMAAYSRVNAFEDVISLFAKLQESGLKPNESILVTVLTACAHLGALAQGSWVHSYSEKHNLSSNPILATAIVDMYSKCGRTDLALSVFDAIPVKDTGAWNAVISGMAMNGKPKTSLRLLDQMASTKIQLSPTTFVAVLSGCTHAKLVKDGLELFNRMGELYGVEPQFEHYACVVDLLARAGMLEEAMEFVDRNLGVFGKGDANVWGAILSACRTYGNVGIGNRVWRKLVEMGVTDYGVHVVCYNMYKEAGWKHDAEEVREMIAGFGVKKTPGCSVVEVDGVVEEFVSGNITHPRAPEIRLMLHSLFSPLNLTERLNDRRNTDS